MSRTVAVALTTGALIVGALFSGGCSGARPTSKPGGYVPWVTGAEAPRVYARRLILAERHEDALAVMDRWEHQFTGLSGRLLRAEALFGIDDFEGSVEIYREALGDSLFWEGHNEGHVLRAAVALLGIGEHESALELCEELSDGDYHHDPNLLMVRGEALFQAGEYFLAGVDFRVALESLDEEHARERMREIEKLMQ